MSAALIWNLRCVASTASAYSSPSRTLSRARSATRACGAFIAASAAARTFLGYEYSACPSNSNFACARLVWTRATRPRLPAASPDPARKPAPPGSAKRTSATLIPSAEVPLITPATIMLFFVIRAAARMTKKSMIVAGVMSGTSADGINVALVRFAEPGGAGFRAGSGEAAGSRGRVARVHTSRAHAKFELLGHAEYSYPKKVRAAALAAMNAPQARVADLARLNVLLGELYADAVLATQRRFQIKAALIGCHGQTLYHQGEAAPYLGRRLAATWQTGES